MGPPDPQMGTGVPYWDPRPMDGNRGAILGPLPPSRVCGHAIRLWGAMGAMGCRGVTWVPWVLWGAVG